MSYPIISSQDVEREDRLKPDPDRRKVIDTEMRRLQEERASLERIPSGRPMPNGTVLIFHIAYENNRTVYTYTAVKARGRWFMSGTGKVPQDAGWGAVERWLTDGDRTLIAVYKVHNVVRLDDSPGPVRQVHRWEDVR